MKLQQKMHFKELSPKNTLARLKSILNDLELNMNEIWQDESIIGTHALRVVFNGTNIGTNGKGVSKEFSEASGLAEFFERFQNNMLTYYTIDGKKHEYDFHISLDEKILTSHEIAMLDNSFMKYYFDKMDINKLDINEKAEFIKKLNRIEYIQYGKSDYYISLPFYSLKQKEKVFLPYNMYRKYYGSNGMCAGNTPEEAMVQGISEIFERMVQKKLFLEKPTLPDIPEDYIKKFPYIYDMFLKLKKNKGFKYMLKDCSLGGKYPVAALIILEENTGMFGIKLGCHPDFGIAMERTFTEAAQGQDILEYTSRSVIDFKNRGVEEKFNIFNSFKMGIAQFPYEILGQDASYEFKPVKDVSNMTNKEILNKWIKEIIDDGYDILIRNVSWCNFPAYHIIIPGLSEMLDVDQQHFRAVNTREFVSTLLMNVEKINKDNCIYIRGILEYYFNSLMDNTISSYRPKSDNSEVPCEDFGYGSMYMIAMCYVMEENYHKAGKIMKTICNKAVKLKVNKERFNLYNAIYYLFSAMEELKEFNKAMEYMSLMFDEKICSTLRNLFEYPENVFIKQYTLKDLYSEEFEIYSKCICKLYNQELKNPIDQQNIYELFSNI